MQPAGPVNRFFWHQSVAEHNHNRTGKPGHSWLVQRNRLDGHEQQQEQELKGASLQTGETEMRALSSVTSIWPGCSVTVDASNMRTRDKNQPT
jgi:hypothetical protein